SSAGLSTDQLIHFCPELKLNRAECAQLNSLDHLGFQSAALAQAECKIFSHDPAQHIAGICILVFEKEVSMVIRSSQMASKMAVPADLIRPEVVGFDPQNLPRSEGGYIPNP